MLTLHPVPCDGPGQWVTHGKSLLNQRWAWEETALGATSAPNLTLSWRFPTAGDVSATPAVYKGVVYAPDWAGFLYAVDQTNGSLIWATNISDYGFPGTAPFCTVLSCSVLHCTAMHCTGCTVLGVLYCNAIHPVLNAH